VHCPSRSPPILTTNSPKINPNNMLPTPASRLLCGHFTKILGAFLSCIRNTFQIHHDIRDFTILTTAGDLFKSTSSSLCNVLNLSPTLLLYKSKALITSRAIYILVQRKKSRFRPINKQILKLCIIAVFSAWDA
jgi:hypothetical protein